MRESVATVKISEALEGGKCALCTLHQEAEGAFLGAFFREMVMDGKSQADLGKQGLCPYHLHLIGEAPDKLGAALALRTLVGTAMTNPQGSYGGCFACSILEKTDQRFAQIIGDYYTSAEGSPLFESTIDRFCLPHVTYLLAVNMPRWREKMGGAFKYLCHEACKHNLQDLAADLEWFIKKFDYRMAEESWRGTEDIVQRVVEKLAGKAGCHIHRQDSDTPKKGKSG